LGTDTDATRHFGLGILIGVALDDPGRDQMQRHMVVGRMPVAGTGPMELMMSLHAFKSYLAPGELQNLSAWPPQATELPAFRFEATAGVVDESGLFKGVVRRDAIVVGLFSTDLDALDTLTTISDLAAAQDLMQAPGRVNVFTLHGDAA